MRSNHKASGDPARGSDRGSPGSCSAIIGSMTQAMTAQTALAEAAIRTGIIKVSSSGAHGGCAYGVEFPCSQSGNVRLILSRAGVRVREYS